MTLGYYLNNCERSEWVVVALRTPVGFYVWKMILFESFCERSDWIMDALRTPVKFCV